MDKNFDFKSYEIFVVLNDKPLVCMFKNGRLRRRFQRTNHVAICTLKNKQHTVS